MILTGSPVIAWEGLDWNEWRKVTMWKKPELKSDQAGQKDLTPILGSARTAAEWEMRRSEYAEIMATILGSPTGEMKPTLEVRELETEVLDDHTRKHIMIRSEADDWIPAYLLIPKTLTAPKLPAMICLHQTVAQGKEEPCGIKGDRELDFALELVQRGFVCIAPDAIGFGERIPPGTQPYHGSLEFYRRHPSWSFMGKMIWDVSRVVDYLQSLSFVDSERIGSIGHSHGAYGTLFAAAFEPRIKAAVASCGFTTFRSDPNPERWSHLTALIPQLGFYLDDVSSIPFDWQHVLALIAPRRLYVWYATKDSIFPRTENLDALFKDVQLIHEVDGKKDLIRWEAFDGPHQFPAAARVRAYDWLADGFGSVAKKERSNQTAEQ